MGYEQGQSLAELSETVAIRLRTQGLPDSPKLLETPIGDFFKAHFVPCGPSTCLSSGLSKLTKTSSECLLVHEGPDVVSGAVTKSQLEKTLMAERGAELWMITRIMDRSVAFEPESTTLGELLVRAVNSRNRFYIMIDQHGNISGVVPVDDILAVGMRITEGLELSADVKMKSH